MTDRSTADIEAAIAAIDSERDRDRMQPTIDAFEALLAAHPDDPIVRYEVGGAYDTAGREQEALHHYEAAMAAGLSGVPLRRCLLQYGSTLRLLGRSTESVGVLRGALTRFPGSPSLGAFLALALQADGAGGGAVALLLELAVEHVDAEDVQRYRAAILGNAAELRGSDAGGPPA